MKNIHEIAIVIALLSATINVVLQDPLAAIVCLLIAIYLRLTTMGKGEPS